MSFYRFSRRSGMHTVDALREAGKVWKHGF